MYALAKVFVDRLKKRVAQARANGAVGGGGAAAADSNPNEGHGGQEAEGESAEHESVPLSRQNSASSV